MAAASFLWVRDGPAQSRTSASLKQCGLILTGNRRQKHPKKKPGELKMVTESCSHQTFSFSSLEMHKLCFCLMCYISFFNKSLCLFTLTQDFYTVLYSLQSLFFCSAENISASWESHFHRTIKKCAKNINLDASMSKIKACETINKIIKMNVRTKSPDC